MTVNNCASIHDNDFGIYVNGEYASLIANGNNIYNNDVGVYWTYHASFDEETDEPLDCVENWWGDEAGPVVGVLSIPPRDSASLGIDYSPWLDGPCPGGDPVGINANLKGVARSGEPGLKVTFTDLSSSAPGCEIIEWLWDFGDGSTSTEQNPVHVYNREGAFTVTLTVWDSCDFSDSITMKAYVTIAKKSDEEKVEPAKLGVSYLNIDPAQVLPNQEVVISANICNSGEERGSKTVSLMVLSLIHI